MALAPSGSPATPTIVEAAMTTVPAAHGNRSGLDVFGILRAFLRHNPDSTGSNNNSAASVPVRVGRNSPPSGVVNGKRPATIVRLSPGREIATISRHTAIAVAARPRCHAETSGIAKTVAASAWRTRTVTLRYLNVEGERCVRSRAARAASP